MHSETMAILIDRLEECLQASLNIVVKETDKILYLVAIKEIIVCSEFVIVIPNFLLVRTVNDYYIIQEKKNYIIDEYCKFGPVQYEEIVREVEDTEIELEFKHHYSKHTL